MLTSSELAHRIARLALEKKGRQVLLLNLNKKSSVADYFVIVSADSHVQLQAVANHISASLRDEGIRILHREGEKEQSWVLLDYVDVVAHIFLQERREFYGLERLWADAKMELVTDELQKS